jgi:tetratricopeptide (TPR) repeat protein
VRWRSQASPLLIAGVVASLCALVALVLVFATVDAARVYLIILFRLLMGAVGIWSIGSVLVGLSIGKVRPMSRGISRRYRRRTQPQQFWRALAWNGTLGAILLTLSFMHFGLSSAALQTRCYDAQGQLPARQSIEACSLLIDHWTLRGSVRSQDAYLARGNSYRRDGNAAHALADYSSAIRIDPKYIAAYENRGMTHLQAGQSGEALDDFTSAIAYSPDDPDLYFLRGYAYQTVVHDPKRAIADYTAALRLKPDFMGPLAQRAACYRAIGDYTHAIADLSAVIRQQPNDADLYLQRSAVYAAAGNAQWAEDDRATAGHLDPSLLKAPNAAQAKGQK